MKCQELQPYINFKLPGSTFMYDTGNLKTLENIHWRLCPFTNEPFSK